MSMFKDQEGKISMMRAMSFIVVISILGIFITHNVVSMARGGGFVGIGIQEAGLISLVLGAKATQSFAELKNHIGIGSKKAN